MQLICNELQTKNVYSSEKITWFITIDLLKEYLSEKLWVGTSLETIDSVLET